MSGKIMPQIGMLVGPCSATSMPRHLCSATLVKAFVLHTTIDAIEQQAMMLTFPHRGHSSLTMHRASSDAVSVGSALSG